MGLPKDLFVGYDYILYVCGHCNDVAVNPVFKVCCARLVCMGCVLFDKCPSDLCEAKSSAVPTGLMVPVQAGSGYFSLKLKCPGCQQLVTIGTLGVHYTVCITSNIHAVKREVSCVLQENHKLKQRNAELEKFLALQQGIIRQMKHKLCTEQILPSSLTNYPTVLFPSSPPIFVWDPHSSYDELPFAVVETLRESIKHHCRNGVVIPLKRFFEPINCIMRSQFEGNWQTFDAKHFDDNRSKCLKHRQIRFSMIWFIEMLGNTKHVTFDLNSMLFQ